MIDNARRIQKDSADSYVAQDHLLLALIQEQQIAAAFKEAAMNETAVKAAVKQIRGNRRVESKTAEKGFDALTKYAIDLTKLAEEGKLDPVIGRVNLEYLLSQRFGNLYSALTRITKFGA